MAKQEYSSNSKFTAGAFANFFAMWLVGLVSTITCGIATPWILCWYMRFIAKHTVINGKQLVFEGSGGSLFGNYIKWLLLSIITFGIYWLVAGQVKLAKWLASNTHLEGYDKSGESKSDFNGKWYQMFGVAWLVGLLTSVTLGIGFAWAACYLVRWYASHVVIDGHEMSFDGKGGQLVGKCILWAFLTIITCGIYSFWLTVKVIKWLVSHIHLAHPEELATPDAPVTETTTTTTETTQTTVNNNDGSVTTTTTTTTTAPAQQQNTIAIVALVLAFFVPLGAIICGAIGLKKANEMGGNGKGLALAGLILGILGTIGTVISIIVYVVVVVMMVGGGGMVGAFGAVLPLLALAL